jgi:hypothetical protein
MEPIQCQVINGERIYKQAKVRRETYQERMERVYGTGLIRSGKYDGMHVGPPTNYVKEPVNR